GAGRRAGLLPRGRRLRAVLGGGEHADRPAGVRAALPTAPERDPRPAAQDVGIRRRLTGADSARGGAPRVAPRTGARQARSMPTRLDSVVIDTADPTALARWWSRTLGWPVTSEEAEEA